MHGLFIVTACLYACVRVCVCKLLCWLWCHHDVSNVDKYVAKMVLAIEMHTHDLWVWSRFNWIDDSFIYDCDLFKWSYPQAQKTRTVESLKTLIQGVLLRSNHFYANLFRTKKVPLKIRVCRNFSWIVFISLFKAEFSGYFFQLS